MKISIILGTRPEIIKMSPVIRECENRNLNYFILHTGQHYSHNMDRVFFEQLQLPGARYNLNVGSGSHAQQTGRMLSGIEKILMEEKPDIVLVEGDTNTVLAGALAASKLHIKVGHVEAGLRSYDRRMPEEINRVLTDHCSDLLFTPTAKSRQILIHENIPCERIFVTGNTIVDAVYQNLGVVSGEADLFGELEIEPKKYFLATVHRQENTDDPGRLGNILEGIERVSHEFSLPVVYPVHPRTRKMIDEFGLHTNGITLIEPLDFLGFLQLESQSRLVLTDSGGVQEETCILGVPCVTLRDSTERPETLYAGSNMLAGTDPKEILRCAKLMINKENGWINPFGDGKSGKRIVDLLNGGLNAN